MTSYDRGLWVSVLNPDFLTCLHESAHACAALHHGLRVTRLAIGDYRRGNQELRGFCELIPGAASKLVRADTLLAGRLFELMMDLCAPARGQIPPNDFVEAASLLVSAGADIEAAVPRVRLLVSSLQPRIERLAAALLEHRDLNEAEILKIVG